MADPGRLFRLHGLVQGVGFRPYAAGLAEKLGLSGYVRNTSGVVTLYLKGDPGAVEEMIHRLSLLKGNSPELPEALVEGIEELSPEKAIREVLPGFHIIGSDQAEEKALPFSPPDIGLCESCREELNTPENRRFRHPLISCASCGPRYTIMKALPYDRERTSMSVHPLCPECREEYIRGRRRHAQTISCLHCGPQVWARSPGVSYSGEEAVNAAVSHLKTGGLIAIKGIGGYHLSCLASETETIMRLRRLKERERRAFAVMLPDMESIRENALCREAEERLLRSSVRPIVLLDAMPRNEIARNTSLEGVQIGAMLPASGLEELILAQTGPLVMTSANAGGEPMLFRDEEMLSFAEEHGVDLVLGYDREILRPLDDSVCRVIELEGKEEPLLADRGPQEQETPKSDSAAGKRSIVQPVRRARGYVPKPIRLPLRLKRPCFGAGGDLKAVFGLGAEDAVYLSGHYGDLEDVRAYAAWQQGIAKLKELLGIEPEGFLADKHPGYFSGAYCDKLASAPAELIQHHHAHILSVMAEHGLTGKTIGLAFDGTGYGEDGSIWGGELLICEGHRMKRAGCLFPVFLPKQDEAAREGKLCAAAYLAEAEKQGYLEGDSLLREDLLRRIPGYSLYREGLKKAPERFIPCSSMGRLFDAVAFLLGISSRNTYEGESAAALQYAAEKGESLDPDTPAISFSLRQGFAMENAPRLSDTPGGHTMPPSPLFADTPRGLVELYQRSMRGERPETLAYAFHLGLARMGRALCERIAEGKEAPVALSGGCMNNRLLLKLLLRELKDAGFSCYINEQVPCGDGGLALGQLYWKALKENTENESPDQKGT